MLAEHADGAYTFGVFPHLPPSQIQRVYAPIAVDFSNALNQKVNFRSTGSYKKFIEQLKSEAFDIVFIQPFDYVLAHDKYNYLPLVRWDIPMTSVIMVKKESSFNTLYDLKGYTIANPSKTAAVSQMTKKALLTAGLDVDKDVTLKYTRSHLSCMQKLILNDAQACGSTSGTLELLAKKIDMTQLRILYETPGIPHVLYAVHRRVPEEAREAIKQAILTWPEREAGKKILQIRNFSTFVPANDVEYNVVRDFWRDEEKPE
ncbi:phosphate/phosphite/phosphonate ABC transporter substrate-binding protein [sulfur-oxidizing endosymbiont of Gigantopelta aegis]|uniref:phosphate/phosphite/phosphonate ABC transporter substrate-binding protein n=1 Tax=sulfur-oxidizing endosymbiont of Gigantopelta aegis TaxID=2794934 RepID=UPI001BE46E44|nr:phosphate/phosphite/phosphonate ABC transporter substrate-binding protein [sulfur-oxidizing endosymbiont of Gigantopelta aegis]